VAKHWSTVVAGYFLAVNDVRDGTGGTNQAHFYAGYPTSGNSTTVVNDGQWHQLVGVYDAGKSISIYVDGQFQSSSPNPSPVQPTPDTTDFLVGGVYNLNGDGKPGGFFTGLITDVGVYDNALSATEIQTIYNQTLSGSAVPEPSTLTLSLVAGALGALGYAWRRRKHVA